MRQKKIRQAIGILALCGCVGYVSAQYQVSGGAKTPLLAVDNTQHRIRVYLVYGTENVTISYTAPSTSHQWYRYRTKALEAEAISSDQQGTTSVISGLEDGCGYFVKEGDELASYIWIIDYSKYPSDLRELRVSEDADPCETLRLDGINETQTLYYQAPIGTRLAIERQYEVIYRTLIWQDNTKQFIQALMDTTIKGDPLRTSFIPPLTDTEIQVTGDLFARHFGVEKSVSTPVYTAVALEVYADTLVTSDSQSNISHDEGAILAPADVRFTAYANSPVASLFIWKVTRSEEPDNPLVRFTEQEMEYSFNRMGDYLVTLEVSDRTGKCTNTNFTYKINITETQMEAPNIFTPEVSPGMNDEFKVAYQSVVRFQAWIFNRMGTELFHWTDPSKGWDGKYRGKYVPAGTYFYVIEYTGTDGKTHKKSGDVMVVRSNKFSKNKGNEVVE